MSKALVLFSGGLDSTVLLHGATLQYPEVIALSMRYGQKHEKELEFAEWTCNKLDVELLEMDLSDIFKVNINSSSLISGSSQEIAHTSYVDQIKQTGMINAYVPYRNGLFLSAATSIAIQLGCDFVLYGAHADDSAGDAYPDCGYKFINPQAEAILEGSGQQVQLLAPFMRMHKSEIVEEGIVAGMTAEDFAHTWSCYEGKETPCGTCGTCRDRKKAFEANGICNID